jgi:hypothetical protein
LETAKKLARKQVEEFVFHWKFTLDLPSEQVIYFNASFGRIV